MLIPRTDIELAIDGFPGRRDGARPKPHSRHPGILPQFPETSPRTCLRGRGTSSAKSVGHCGEVLT